MAYSSLKEAIVDMEKHGYLVRVKEEVDPFLQMSAIHRRVNQAGGPAVYFERVKGSSFPAVSNLFGTIEQSRFLFRHTFSSVEALIRCRANPKLIRKYPQIIPALFHLLPLSLPFHAKPVLFGKTQMSCLPLIHSWPKDGGPFITLPEVYTEDMEKPGIFQSNLGMYRIQMKGNRYQTNLQAGLHYQIHRGIGIHHSKAIQKQKSLPVSVFVGGPPAHILSAVMPLPEGLPEVLFIGALAGRNFRYLRKNSHLISSDADFCILGNVSNNLLPEGPFGDHLGYYAKKHLFPVLDIHSVYHRKDAVWPFTVVGRPPQEDTVIGKLIHELVSPMVPVSIPGVRALHAVDAAGVHPLMLAIGRESYEPYKKRRPAELLTAANAILGFGQASLAKYLLITAEEDDPHLDVHNVESFLGHLLARVDWKRDLHFQTCTTMDTLDYSGTGLNQGSRLVIAAAGRPIRRLGRGLPKSLSLPTATEGPSLVIPGVIVLQTLPFISYPKTALYMKRLESFLSKSRSSLKPFPMIVIVDDRKFVSRNFQNFLWTVFTRSNPSHDIYGIDSFIEHKHWGCKGSLIIDARIKPHHSSELQTDPSVEKSVERLAEHGKSLHGVI